MKVKPLNDYILVEPIIENMLYPSTTKGKVVAVSNKNTDIKVGDIIVFFGSCGSIKIDEKQYIILRQENIVAIIGE